MHAPHWPEGVEVTTILRGDVVELHATFKYHAVAHVQEREVVTSDRAEMMLMDAADRAVRTLINGALEHLEPYRQPIKPARGSRRTSGSAKSSSSA